MSGIWLNSNKQDWVEKFKDVFINQKFSELTTIFNSNKFGLHNGLSMSHYCEVEFEEFRLKCEKFGLTINASITCYDITEDLFYFSLGKKDDMALFEAIFGWDSLSGLAIGNQYQLKIEPKMQFIINNTKNTTYKRRVNLKFPQKDTEIFKVMLKIMGNNPLLNKESLDEHLGGYFYGFSQENESEDMRSYLDEIKIYTNKGIIKQKVLMRGSDHPLFLPDLYPTVALDKKSFKIKEGIFPVIIFVRLENGEDFFYKYPLEQEWCFDCEIKEICLTDTLSFDWIIKL